MTFKKHFELKKVIPLAIAALGVAFVGVWHMLKSAPVDAETPVTNILGFFMLIAGCICIMGGALFFFLRDEHDFWS